MPSAPLNVPRDHDALALLQKGVAQSIGVAAGRYWPSIASMRTPSARLQTSPFAVPLRPASAHAEGPRYAGVASTGEPTQSCGSVTTASNSPFARDQIGSTEAPSSGLPVGSIASSCSTSGVDCACIARDGNDCAVPV